MKIVINQLLAALAVVFGLSVGTSHAAAAVAAPAPTPTRSLAETIRTLDNIIVNLKIHNRQSVTEARTSIIDADRLVQNDENSTHSRIQALNTMPNLFATIIASEPPGGRPYGLRLPSKEDFNALIDEVRSLLEATAAAAPAPAPTACMAEARGDLEKLALDINNEYIALIKTYCRSRCRYTDDYERATTLCEKHNQKIEQLLREFIETRKLSRKLEPLGALEKAITSSALDCDFMQAQTLAIQISEEIDAQEYKGTGIPPARRRAEIIAAVRTALEAEIAAGSVAVAAPAPTARASGVGAPAPARAMATPARTGGFGSGGGAAWHSSAERSHGGGGSSAYASAAAAPAPRGISATRRAPAGDDDVATAIAASLKTAEAEDAARRAAQEEADAALARRLAAEDEEARPLDSQRKMAERRQETAARSAEALSDTENKASIRATLQDYLDRATTQARIFHESRGNEGKLTAAKKATKEIIAELNTFISKNSARIPEGVRSLITDCRNNNVLTQLTAALALLD